MSKDELLPQGHQYEFPLIYQNPAKKLAREAWVENFLTETFEIAFGEDAIHKEYTSEEVIDKLREFAEEAWVYRGLL